MNLPPPNTVHVIAKFADKIILEQIFPIILINKKINGLRFGNTFGGCINFMIGQSKVRLFPKSIKLTNVPSLKESLDLINDIFIDSSVKIDNIYESLVSYTYKLKDINFNSIDTYFKSNNTCKIMTDMNDTITVKHEKTTFLIFKSNTVIQGSKNQQLAEESFDWFMEQLSVI
jgi:hypothetical protein